LRRGGARTSSPSSKRRPAITIKRIERFGFSARRFEPAIPHIRGIARPA
jgi:hypothetical protein